MWATCAGVTREKLGRNSNAGSAFLVDDEEDLFSSVRLETDRLIGETSPSLVNGESSTFISTSFSPSVFVLGLSSWVYVQQ